jgi:vacuolar protein sorting-associated protein 54
LLIRTDKHPVDMDSVNDTLFDILASASELVNSLASRVLAVRTEQNSKLELQEFAELFTDTWNFFVRCEVICRRMIVSLRGVISGQVC